MRTQTKQRASSRQPVRPLRHLHRITGLCILLPVLFLVSTGLALQYTDALRLGQAYVSGNWVHRAYGVRAPDTAITSASVTQVGSRLFVGTRMVERDEPLIGAISSQGLHIAAFATSVLLLATDPSIPAESISLPARAIRIGGSLGRQIYLDTEQGTLTSDDLGVTWQPDLGGPRQWATTTLAQDLPFWQDRYKSANVSWERWFVDLHSGRFFGPFGELIMSLASLALSLVAISGLIVWIFLRRAR